MQALETTLVTRTDAETQLGLRSNCVLYDVDYVESRLEASKPGPRGTLVFLGLGGWRWGWGLGEG